MGKSSLLLRYSDDSFSSTFITTIGIDFKVKNIVLEDSSNSSVKYKTRLQIWDTAGQERFRSINASYYRGANCILLLYDVSDQSSFESVRNWILQIEENADANVHRVLVGNKADVEGDDRVGCLAQ